MNKFHPPSSKFARNQLRYFYIYSCIKVLWIKGVNKIHDLIVVLQKNNTVKTTSKLLTNFP